MSKTNRVTAMYQVTGVPAYKGNPFIEALPPILSPDAVHTALASYPAYESAERKLPSHIRLHCIRSLSQYFEVIARHYQLEQRFSVVIRQGYIGRNPVGPEYTKHLRNGHERVMEGDLGAASLPTTSTADAFSIIGLSGVGKSTAVNRILDGYPHVIEHPYPVAKTQIVWLRLDCPVAGSLKSLCKSFFEEVDRLVGTDYSRKYHRGNIDDLLAQMAQVANLHAVGVIVIDELQHLSLAKAGGDEAMLNFFVTLVNTIGIPVVMIGTMKVMRVLQGDFRQARRAVGAGSFIWDRLQQDEEWDFVLDGMWHYQWTAKKAPLTQELKDELYDVSQGLFDILIKVYALAQEWAIASGREELPLGIFRKLLRDRMSLVVPMLEALRSGDPKKIIKYADFAPPTWDQIWRTQPLAMPALTPDTARWRQVAEHEPLADRVADVLCKTGVNTDVARWAARETVGNQPEGDPLELMASALALIEVTQTPGEIRGPNNGASKGEKKQSSPPVIALEQDPRDIRKVAGDGVNAYETLCHQGMVKNPLQEFQILH